MTRGPNRGSCRIVWAHLWEAIQLHWICLSSVRSASPQQGHLSLSLASIWLSFRLEIAVPFQNCLLIRLNCMWLSAGHFQFPVLPVCEAFILILSEGSVALCCAATFLRQMWQDISISQDDCISSFDMKSAFPVSLCLMQNRVHNVLIPIQVAKVVGVCTALCYPFDKFRQASQACWVVAGVLFPRGLNVIVF